MTESNKKNKKLNISHNKSKSGAGSIIKFHSNNNNIFNIKSGNILKGANYNFKKFKSISPTIRRRNFKNVIIKEKKKLNVKVKAKVKLKEKVILLNVI